VKEVALMETIVLVRLLWLAAVVALAIVMVGVATLVERWSTWTPKPGTRERTGRLSAAAARR
jgi:uncharacterized membrane protein